MGAAARALSNVHVILACVLQLLLLLGPLATEGVTTVIDRGETDSTGTPARPMASRHNHKYVPRSWWRFEDPDQIGKDEMGNHELQPAVRVHVLPTLAQSDL